MTSSDSSSRSASSASTVKLRSWRLAWRASSSTRGVKLGQHALARHRLVARMQRREFHGNSRPRRQRGVAGARADRLDGVGVGLEIARGVGGGARALAQHVEGIAELAVRAGARQRLLDGLAQHEMRAEQPHRLPGRDPHRRQAEPLHEAVDDAVRGLARMDHPRGDAERPGRGRDQEARRSLPPCDQSPAASLSSISRSAVAASGTRSSASASTISARPSLVESE